MKAKDIMTTPVITVGPNTEIQEIAQLLLERRISGAPVVSDDGRVLGIISEGDLIGHAGTVADDKRRGSWWLRFFADPATRAKDYSKHHGRFAHEVMTRDVVTVSEDETLPKIASLLESRKIKRVPVVRDGQMVGIISRANLLHGLATAKLSTVSSASDSKLRDALQAAIKESGIRTTFLNVVISDGVAQLWGVMESREERDALLVVVENIEGLKRVENHVNVFGRTVRNAMGAV